MKKNIFIGVLMVLVAAVSFYGGMQYANGRKQGSFNGNRNNFATGNFPGTGANGQRRTGSGGNFINGEIVAKDDKSITLKLRDGGSKIVFFSASSTRFVKNTEGSVADAVAGATVMINGISNQDGSVSASSVQIVSSSTMRF